MSEISTLNSLIETLKDGQEGFREASHEVEAAELKTVLLEYSVQRENYATELQQLAKSLGDPSPATTGSLMGAVHRGWIDLKAALVTRNAHAILAECERGEDSAVAEYEKALSGNSLSTFLRERVTSQYNGVKAAHDRIRALRDSLAPR
jgi:uncharacterized protein (TIGR02284 family)